MAELLESGDLQHHIASILLPSYARRYYSMISAVERYLVPLGVQLPQTDRHVLGGYFIWLALPSPLVAESVALRAKEAENMIIAPGPMFGVYGDADEPGLKRKVRLCFSWEAPELLEEGIKRLGLVV